MSRTLLICKPDAVERGLVGQIIDRIERKGLRIVAGALRPITEAEAKEHYAEHAERAFYGELVEFITRSPSFLCVVEGPEETWKLVRSVMGPTNPADAPPGTIRGDFGTEVAENLVHGSDAETSAQREVRLFFPDLP